MAAHDMYTILLLCLQNGAKMLIFNAKSPTLHRITSSM